jgi:transposase
MERRKFTREFKLEAVRLIKDRRVSYVQASQAWACNVAVARLGEEARRRSATRFSRTGQMKPDQLQIARLKREVAKLKAERDILKNARGNKTTP